MNRSPWEQIRRAAGAVVAGVLCLGVAGCGKDSAPDVPAKIPAPAAPPVTGAVNKDKKPDVPAGNAATRRDAALAASVKDALAADSRLKSFGIDVRAANGAVELYGTVDAKATRDRAAKVVAGVGGVNSVKNHIVLLGGS